MENALVMIAVLDKKGTIFAWNHAAESITGYTKAAVIGNTNVWKSLYPDKNYRNSVTRRIAEILAAKDSFENFETTIHTRTGTPRIILWNTKEIVREGMSRIVAVGQDVTHLKELDAFRQSIIDNANDLITVLDSKGKILVWNKAAELITGYLQNEVVGNREIWKWLYPDTDYRRTITKRITDIITTKKYFENIETTIVTKTGEQRIISWNTKQIGSGGNYQAIAIGRDITEIAKAKREIKRNAEFQESVIINAKLWMTFLDNKNNVVIWNKAAEEITGYTHEEVVGHGNIWKWIYPDNGYRKVVTRKIIDIVSNKKFLENFETDIRTKSGETRRISWNTRELDGDDGERLGYIVVGNDITEIAKAKREIKRNAAFQESIIINAKLWMTFLDNKNNVVIWNKAAEEITGYTRDEVVGHGKIWKWIYPDDAYRKEVTKKIIDIVSNKKYLENFETDIRTKSGEIKKIRWNTRVLLDEDGNGIGNIVIGSDITEIIKARQEIQRNAAFQESVIINAKLWMTFLDNKNNVVIWNKAAEEITGYTRDEVVGHGNVWKWIYPDDAYRKEVTKKIIDIVKNKKYLENFETDIRTKAGETRRISWNTRELDGDDGERLGYIVVGNDITEQRKTEAFRESIINNANVLITVLDSKGKILVWNMAAETITGYLRNEVIGTRDIWKWLYPDADYRRSVTKQITSIITSRKYFEDLETTIVTKSGEQRIILWNTRQIGSGGDYQAIAIGRDVTERKRAEEALLAYISEMGMRLKQPVEIVRDNLQETVHLINGGKLTKEEMVTMLEGQVRNATQIAANVQEFQKAIAEKNKEIPEAYRKFLEG
jgi:PAS domain S-box-containing protein